MGEYDKSYSAFKLPPRKPEGNRIQSSLSQRRTGTSIPQKGGSKDTSLKEETYYEIEYDATPMPGVGKFVLKTQKIEKPEKDEIRELFDQMRDIARNNRFVIYGSTKFYNEKVRQENSRVFYKQGMFMKDFEDNYEESAAYKEYFPYYQMMGYRQLRTYFTWRAQVRKDKIENTSLSYAYLYLYELLNNIGVSDPQEGLNKLLSFWKEFRGYHPDIDKYVLRWLKDYHIYYDLPQSFAEFVSQQGLSGQYPSLTGTEDRFDLYCTLSKYDIKKSVFYSEERETLIRDCFDFTMDRLITVFQEHDIDLESAIFLPTKSRAVWRPFQDALFYPWMQQRDRSVVLSSKEIYVCSQNQWTYQTALTADSGRRLVSYILKQMESVLRQTMKFKYKITAGIDMMHPTTVKRLKEAGVALEQGITAAVTEFYREATKTVVTVDRETLAKIRKEALMTQEKLIVPEEEEIAKRPPMPIADQPDEQVDIAFRQDATSVPVYKDFRQVATPSSVYTEPTGNDVWSELGKMLTQTEREALILTLCGNANIKQFADVHGIMLEVLADGINEKAVDAMGDSLLDDDFMIYDDYLEQVRIMLDAEMRER